jgi:DNA-damage-inducible protein J
MGDRSLLTCPPCNWITLCRSVINGKQRPHPDPYPCRDKQRASAFLESIGLTVSDAVRILLTKTANEGAPAFSISTDAAPYDAWLRRTVRETIDGSEPKLSSEEVEAYSATRRVGALRRLWQEAAQDTSPGLSPDDVLDRLERKYRALADVALSTWQGNSSSPDLSAQTSKRLWTGAQRTMLYEPLHLSGNSSRSSAPLPTALRTSNSGPKSMLPVKLQLSAIASFSCESSAKPSELKVSAVARAT